MKQRRQKGYDVIKALRLAERELELERNGYDHPWVAITKPHKNKKLYNRKRDKKNFDYDSNCLFCFIYMQIIFA